ncbi:MAG: prepilin-type N-terminal cleavage/methylation domain-containing protein [Bdellovibrionota bacterium]
MRALFSKQLKSALGSKKGFTLIEVVLALMVMASGLFILTNSWSGTYNRLRKTQIQVQIAALLERKVTEIEREYKNKSLESIPEEKEDNFGSELPQYSWKLKSKKFEMPDLSAALISQDGGADQTTLSLMKVYTDYLSKTVKEINVSVIFKEGKKPLVADVTIYMIDYNQPLPLPGAGGGGATQ